VGYCTSKTLLQNRQTSDPKAIAGVSRDGVRQHVDAGDEISTPANAALGVP